MNMNRREFLLYAAGAALLPGCSGGGSNGDSKGSGEKIEPVATTQTLVIGAGIAGLSCAYFLRDQDVMVLEKNGMAGGRTLSAMHKSFTYAKGTEYLGAPQGALQQMIGELQLTPTEIPSPMDAYFDGNHFFYGHEGIKKYLIDNSGVDAYAKFTNLLLTENKKYSEVPDLVYNDQVQALDNMTASQWLCNNGIPEVFIKKYNVSSKGLFGATVDEISALSLISEAAFDYQGENTLASATAAAEERSGAYSFAKGLTELTAKLAEVLKGKIKCNSTVVSIIKEGDAYSVSYIGADNKTSVVSAKKIVLAVPAPVALKIAPTLLSGEKADLIKTVKYSSYATVALFSATPVFNQAFDLAVPNGYFFTDVYDATWIEKFYDNNKKNLGEYIASIYVAPQTSNDHTLDVMSDEELLENVYKDLNKIFPGASAKVSGYDIQRFPYAYPVMSLGAYKRLLRLDELNRGTLILAGDYLIYPTFEAAVQSGRLAADRIRVNI